MSMSGNPLQAIGGNNPFGNLPAALPGFLQGAFGNSGAPYQKAYQASQPFFQGARNYQNPFYQQAQSAIPQFQQWNQGMQDPSAFINHLMNSYQESPWAKYQQQQAMRAGINAASAGGLPSGEGGAGIGSTPFLQQAQQNAANISSQDMSKWLQNVLGINSDYGQGLNQQLGYGQHAGDILSQLANDEGHYAGGSAYGQEAGRQQDQGGWIAGLAKLFGGANHGI